MHRKVDPIARRRLVVGVLGWLAFALCWWLVLRRDPRTWWRELAVPLASLAFVGNLTLLWVRHNLSIFQRKGPRRGLPSVERPWTTDTLGRPLDIPRSVATASVVEVDVVDGDKVYRAAS
jgi:hypothetical protein